MTTKKKTSSKKGSKRQIPEYDDHEVKVLRAHEYFNKKRKQEVLFFDVEINGVRINGCTLVDGKNGEFTSFPSYKGSDGEYYNYAWVGLSDKDQKKISKQVHEMLDDEDEDDEDEDDEEDEESDYDDSLPFA